MIWLAQGDELFGEIRQLSGWNGWKVIDDGLMGNFRVFR